MLNNVVIVGRLMSDVELIKEDEKESAIITLKVPRPYKNADGIYEDDIISCEVWGAVAQNTNEYCKVGDIIGVKGSVRSYKENDEMKMKIVVDKVTFLSSSKETSN